MDLLDILQKPLRRASRDAFDKTLEEVSKERLATLRKHQADYRRAVIALADGKQTDGEYLAQVMNDLKIDDEQLRHDVKIVLEVRTLNEHLHDYENRIQSHVAAHRAARERTKQLEAELKETDRRAWRAAAERDALNHTKINRDMIVHTNPHLFEGETV